MGNNQSNPASTDAQTACPAVGSSSKGEQDPTTTTTSQPTCPVPASARSRAVYNVYSQRIDLPQPDDGQAKDPLAALRASDILDPKNNMPLAANQQPCPGQRRLLSTDRIESTIPKGGTDATWVYPSPQMFYNALKRKGKGGDVREEHMDAVVRAHNTMNEVTWHRVREWEALHCDTCPHPSLLKFRGRPDDLSPLARLRGWLGGPLPFDRHDWTVDRCGAEVRYVIDFYYDDAKAGTPNAFEIVARPALDSPGAALDRAKMAIYEAFAAWGLPCPISGHSGRLAAAAAAAQRQVGAEVQQQQQQQQQPVNGGRTTAGLA
jgi:cytochrome c heme-lyase